MKISSTAKYALGVTAAAAMLAGCSSGASSSFAPTSQTAGAQASHGAGATSTFTAQIGFKGVTTDTRESWMSPEAKKGKTLLYISDAGAGDVQVYAWPKPKTAVGTLTGFSEPQGECADNSGNVFITNTGGSNILEYKAGGKTPSNTLTDSGQYPVGCSVDSKGNLAVSNIISTSGGAGSVTIYAKAKGTGKNYNITGLQKDYFLGYDKTGNLWISGETSSSAPAFAELTSKGKVVNGTISGATIGFPGGTLFDGKNVTTGDQTGGKVYQLKGFKVSGTTSLTGTSDVVQYWISDKLLIAPDAGTAAVEIFKYPAGGTATQTLSGFSQPIGSTVSGSNI